MINNNNSYTSITNNKEQSIKNNKEYNTSVDNINSSNIIQEEIDVILKDDYDKEYLILLEEIENRLNSIKRHDLIRVTSWIKKLNQITSNKEWKKNRNLYALYLLDMILNNYFEEPFNKFPPDGNIPILSKSLVKSKLSSKFELILGSLENRLSINLSRPGNERRSKKKDENLIGSENIIYDSQIDNINYNPGLTGNSNQVKLQVQPEIKAQNQNQVNNNSIIGNNKLESIKEEEGKDKENDNLENMDNIDNFYSMVKVELSEFTLLEKYKIIESMIKERNDLIERMIKEKEVLLNIKQEYEKDKNKKDKTAKENNKEKDKFNYSQTFGKRDIKEYNDNNGNKKLNRYRFI